MDQVTASLSIETEEGASYLVTDYEAVCGCHWRVDHRGNVRSVRVCRICMDLAFNFRAEQMDLF